MLEELDEITQEIYRKYKSALKYIGVDFSREDVREAIGNCGYGMEAAFQSIIEYWINLQNKNKKIDYPSALLIAALNNHWHPYNWQDEYLEDPRFKSICLKWWEEAGKLWGNDTRNQLIADVYENNSGEEYILLTTGEKISLRIAQVRRWNWLLNYAQSQQF
ncbi:hypothetical protein [Myxosarcina sp. GI1(2024)]